MFAMSPLYDQLKSFVTYCIQSNSHPSFVTYQMMSLKNCGRIIYRENLNTSLFIWLMLKNLQFCLRFIDLLNKYAHKTRQGGNWNSKVIFVSSPP